MASRMQQCCPFFVPSMVTDSNFFVGRTDALEFLQSKMTGSQPTSVNLVGEHKIGKSSLLWRFYKLRNQSKYDNSRFAVIYLSFQDASCQRENTFYKAVVRELSNLPMIRAKPVLVRLFQNQTWDRSTFSEAMKECHREGVLPVLCLDKFEALFQESYLEEFDEGFYDNLHSLINHSTLMLVLASLKALDIYRTQHKLTSSFFNVGLVYPLKEFTREEAQQLVRLPQGRRSGVQPALKAQYQNLALQWGKQHPLLLQMAGSCLWEAQKKNKSVNWAKQEFEQQARAVLQLQTRASYRNQSLRLLVFLFWKLPIRLGSQARNVGIFVNDLVAWGIGISLIIIGLMCVFGLIPGNYLSDLLKKYLCSGLSGALGKWCDG